MADHDSVPEADALEQALPPADADPTEIDLDDEPEVDGPDGPDEAAERRRPLRAVPASVAGRPLPADANEQDVLEQRLPAGGDDDEDDFR